VVVKVEELIVVEVRAPVFTVPKAVKPLTFKPFKLPNPVIDPPTPTLPVVVSEVALMVVEFKLAVFTFPREDNPETFNPPNTPTEVTVKEAPIPVLPETFKVPVIPVLERAEKLDTFKALIFAKELTVRELPNPTLPDAVRVENCEFPETNRDESRLTPDETVKDEPIPTLPEVFKVFRLEAPLMPKVAPEILLVTCNESRKAADVTVSD
jgi:hypothetical protein